MGCDIHAYLEVRRFHYEDTNRQNGFWINADKWTVDEGHIKYPEDYKRRFHIDREDRIYAGRNYCLFAILANVRNYWDVPFISEPRGLPDNVSEETKSESDDWGVDGHSHSWLTLEDIMAFTEWDKAEEGSDWAFDAEHAEKLKQEYGDKFTRFEPKNIGMTVFYKTTLQELCESFHEKTIKRMKSYLREHENPVWQIRPEDVRLVFWFDN